MLYATQKTRELFLRLHFQDALKTYTQNKYAYSLELEKGAYQNAKLSVRAKSGYAPLRFWQSANEKAFVGKLTAFTLELEPQESFLLKFVK